MWPSLPSQLCTYRGYDSTTCTGYDRFASDFEDAIIESGEGVYEDDFVQANGEHRTRLSTRQAIEFRDRLVSLVAEYFALGSGDRSRIKYGFHWVFMPIDLHPLDASDLPTIMT